MDSSYVTGSQNSREVVSKAIAAGRPPQHIRIAAPPYHAVPRAQVEGVEGIDRTAACGEVCGFVDTSHPWRRGLGSGSDWCPRCVELVP